LELRDFCGVGGAQDIKADSRGGLWGEALDTFVADGVVGDDGFPCGAVPDFDAEGLDLLAIGETLHDQGVIESHGLGEIYFQR